MDHALFFVPNCRVFYLLNILFKTSENVVVTTVLEKKQKKYHFFICLDYVIKER